MSFTLLCLAMSSSLPDTLPDMPKGDVHYSYEVTLPIALEKVYAKLGHVDNIEKVLRLWPRVEGLETVFGIPRRNHHIHSTNHR